MKLEPKYDNFEFPTTSVDTRSGTPGHLDAGQQAQVDQLRMMLEGEGFTSGLDTLTLLRFLRARKFDVNAAKKMFTDSMAWRKDMTILDVTSKKNRKINLDPQFDATKPEQVQANEARTDCVNLDEQVPIWDKDGSFKRELSKHYVQFYHKTDKDGRPCYFEQLGGIKFDKLKELGFTNDRMLLNLAVEYEKMADPRLPACSRKAGHLLETSCTVMDVAGLSILSPGDVYGFIQQASAMSNNNYPERLGLMYVINVNFWLKQLWKVVKGFLDPVTASKINILGTDYKSELLKQIPAENLPEMFGGKCKCEGGCQLSDAGPWREAEWYKPAWWEKEGATTIENKETPAPAEGAQTEVTA
ncbi:Sec14 cytosolic factor [Xylariomycetidae sp. FL0641]|nr:Sec14 cytosolic factor [Xylariomycetidae sp. FL0641]